MGYPFSFLWEGIHSNSTINYSFQTKYNLTLPQGAGKLQAIKVEIFKKSILALEFLILDFATLQVHNLATRSKKKKKKKKKKKENDLILVFWWKRDQTNKVTKVFAYS